MLLANLLQTTSDDQTAIIGGLVAMFLAGGVMYLSYFVGPEARRQRVLARAMAVRPMPQPPKQRHDRAA